MDAGPDALADVRRWLTGCRLQLDRLRSDRGRWIAAVTDLTSHQEIPASLMAVLDQIAVDHHFLVRSAKSLRQAIDRLDKRHPLRDPMKEAVRRLRRLEGAWCEIASALRGGAARFPRPTDKPSLDDGPWGRWDPVAERLQLRQPKELAEIEELLARLEHALAGDGSTEWPTAPVVPLAALNAG